MFALMVLYGGIVSRLHGMDLLPRWVRNVLWSVPFAVCAYFASTQIWVLPVVFGLCWLGKTVGHGNFFEPGDKDDIKGPEKVEYLILWLKRYIGAGHLYNAIGMALAGLAAVLGAGLVIGWYAPSAGLAIAIGGLLKGFAYTIGRLIYPIGKSGPIPYLRTFTNIGEFLTGIFAFTGLAVACLITGVF